MPAGMRAIITIGEVKGMIEHQKASDELGSFITTNIIISARMMGSTIGVVSCPASITLSTLAPTAANSAE